MIQHDCPLKPWTCWMHDGVSDWELLIRIAVNLEGFHLKIFEKLN
jgi:hypothetical protein